MSDMKTYYVRTDDSDTPIRLLRADGGTVAVWNGAKSEWVDTDLSPMQLGGMGGSADYRRVRGVDSELWQQHFTVLG